MRIVGGTYKGRRIASPPNDKTRPTSDRLRESLFNRLAHSIDGFQLEGARVLDLFAGTGALGLEALSRGASFALFVEEASPVRGVIRRNIEDLELTGVTKLFKRDATKLGKLQRLAPFNLLFLDPPYGKSLAEKALESCRTGGWIEENALIILEEAKSSTITWPDTITPFDTRTTGDTTLHFARYTSNN
jgi:16S rRNA (guanine966-N2)-methyltransferase